MAAPNYEQIQSFGNVKTQLVETALNEFRKYLYEGIPLDEVVEIATAVGEQFSILGGELGAQWYDLCTELAGIEAEPAELSPMDRDAIAASANAAATRVEAGVIEDVFKSYLQNVINESIRTTGTANLWRDYERGLAGGKWTRVPVGDTCAWCLMLASQGAYYLSKKSALGETPDHYHRDCNCIAVYHADAESIKGYAELAEYKRMYYEAENANDANATGRDPYPEELAERIARARAEHSAREDAREQAAEERGEYYKRTPWTRYNEDMIILRYRYGLK